MFLQSCFIIKDTQELRDKLKEIGINPYPCIVPKCINYLFVNRGFYSRNEIGYKEEIDSAIDCGTNEDLFLALAALRDDSDYMQYFVCGDSFVLCDREGWLDMYSVLHSGGKYSIEELDNAHKATVEELIEHFKEK